MDFISRWRQHSENTQYLKNTLGDILPKALKEVCQHRPQDPIEFLARSLYKAVDCELYYHDKAIFSNEMQLMALQLKQENENRQAVIGRLRKQIHELKAIILRHKELQASLWLLAAKKGDATFVPSESESGDSERQTAEFVKRYSQESRSMSISEARRPRRRLSVRRGSTWSRSSQSSSSDYSKMSLQRQSVDQEELSPMLSRRSSSSSPRTGELSSLRRSVQRFEEEEEEEEKSVPVVISPASSRKSTLSGGSHGRKRRKSKSKAKERLIEKPGSPSTVDSHVSIGIKGIELSSSEEILKMKEEILDVVVTSREPVSDVKSPTRKRLSEVEGTLRKRLSDVKSPTRKSVSEVEGTLRKRLSDVKGSSKKRVSEGEGTLRKRFSEVEGTLKKRVSDVGGTSRKRVSEVEGTSREPISDVESVEVQPEKADKLKQRKFSLPKEKYTQNEEKDETSEEKTEMAKEAEEDTEEVYDVEDRELTEKTKEELSTDEYALRKTKPTRKKSRTFKVGGEMLDVIRKKKPVPSLKDQLFGETQRAKKEISQSEDEEGRKEETTEGGENEVSEDITSDFDDTKVSAKFAVAAGEEEDIGKKVSAKFAIAAEEEDDTKVRAKFAIAAGGEEEQTEDELESALKTKKKRRRWKSISGFKDSDEVEDYDHEKEMRRKMKKRKSRQSMYDESEEISLSRLRSVDDSPSVMFEEDVQPGKAIRRPKTSSLKRRKSSRRVEEGPSREELEPAEKDISGVSLAISESLHVSMTSLQEPEQEPEWESQFTPVECEWALVGPRTLVCRHPILGELRSQPTSVPAAQDFRFWPDRFGYEWHNFYDPEVYTVEELGDTRIKSRSKSLRK